MCSVVVIKLLNFVHTVMELNMPSKHVVNFSNILDFLTKGSKMPKTFKDVYKLPETQ